MNLGGLWEIADGIGHVRLDGAYIGRKQGHAKRCRASIDFKNGPSGVSAVGEAATAEQALQIAIQEARRLSPPRTISHDEQDGR